MDGGKKAPKIIFFISHWKLLAAYWMVKRFLFSLGSSHKFLNYNNDYNQGLSPLFEDGRERENQSAECNHEHLNLLRGA